jgi:hypothetical protein
MKFMLSHDQLACAKYCAAKDNDNRYDLALVSVKPSKEKENTLVLTATDGHMIVKAENEINATDVWEENLEILLSKETLSPASTKAKRKEGLWLDTTQSTPGTFPADREDIWNWGEPEATFKLPAQGLRRLADLATEVGNKSKNTPIEFTTHGPNKGIAFTIPTKLGHNLKGIIMPCF